MDQVTKIPVKPTTHFTIEYYFFVHSMTKLLELPYRVMFIDEEIAGPLGPVTIIYWPD